MEKGHSEKDSSAAGSILSTRRVYVGDWQWTNTGAYGDSGCWRAKKNGLDKWIESLDVRNQRQGADWFVSWEKKSLTSIRNDEVKYKENEICRPVILLLFSIFYFASKFNYERYIWLHVWLFEWNKGATNTSSVLANRSKIEYSDENLVLFNDTP